jgi:hypothetical protein
MSKEGKLILVAIGIVFALGVYAHWATLDRLDRVEQRAAMCNCPQSNAADLALSAIDRTARLTASSHAYAELLLEGLVRHAGLPLEQARAAFEALKGADKPRDWQWLEPWEQPGTGGTPAQPASTPGGAAGAAPQEQPALVQQPYDITTPRPLPAGWSWKDGYLRGPGSPDPLACASDADCVCAMLVDPGGCCQPVPWPFPQTKAYQTWLVAHVESDECRAVVCPPGPLPSPPPQCTYEPRCKDGACATACP